MPKFKEAFYTNGQWECAPARVSAKYSRNANTWRLSTPWGDETFPPSEIEKAFDDVINAVRSCWKSRVSAEHVSATLYEVLNKQASFQEKLKATAEKKQAEWSIRDLTRAYVRHYLVNSPEFLCQYYGMYSAFYGDHRVDVTLEDDNCWWLYLDKEKLGLADPPSVITACTKATTMSKIDELAFISKGTRVSPCALVLSDCYVSFVLNTYTVNGRYIKESDPVKVVWYCHELDKQ